MTEEMHFRAQLDGEQELPKRDTPATGVLHLSFEDDCVTYELTVHDICNVILAHLHVGSKGKEGDPVPVYTMFRAAPGGGPVDGVLACGSFREKNLRGPLKGRTLGALRELCARGKIYVDVHTKASKSSSRSPSPGNYPLGEIRGQLQPTNWCGDGDNDHDESVQESASCPIVSLLSDVCCR